MVGLPAGPGPHPVAVLIHGGFWRAKYGLDYMDALQIDLVGRGFATYNLEYRRVGHDGGGYPGTLHDVAAGVDHLAEIAAELALDLSRVALIGHSAGGHLALWCAGRDQLPAGAPGAGPLVQPQLVIGLAAVIDLTRAAADGLGDGAIQEFIGGEPAEHPEAYRVAQPMLDPATTVLIHGDNDDRVPLEQSQQYADQVQVVVVPNEDHFDVIDPSTRSWAAALEALDRFRSP